jgi:methionine biosynthesis protein MetW
MRGRSRCGCRRRGADSAIAAITCWWRRWSSRDRACSTSAAARAICCACWKARGVDGRGIELSREGVNRCVAKGLAVIQGDADTDLVDYPDDSFDYVILSQTLQATRRPRCRARAHAADRTRTRDRFVPELRALEDAAAIAGQGPDAAHREPARRAWYDTPNIHFCTIKDFVQLCDEIDASRWNAPSRWNPYGRPLRLSAPWWFWNMFGEQGVFLLSRAGKTR